MTTEPRGWVAELPAYRPGRRASTGAGSLASNEVGRTSPMAAAAVALASAALHRYPDPLASALRGRLATLHGTPEDRILVGAGTDELMSLLAAAYVAGGGSIVCADPGYWGHRHAASAVGAKVLRVPCRDHRHDLEAMARIPADIAFICNPHNPTGTVVGREALERFIRGRAARLVVVDEAYIDFADRPHELTALGLDDDVVVLRTMSKFFGLAALRVGYMVGPPNVVDVLNRLRTPFSVNHLAQVAAVAALDDVDHQAAVRAGLRANRAASTQLFEAAGFEVVDSQANFVLVLTDDETGLLDRLSSAGVRVRPGTDLGVPGSVRVTIPDDDGLRLIERAIAGGHAVARAEGGS